MRRVIISPGEGERRVAKRPSLTSGIGQADRRAEAIARVWEAVEASVMVLEADGLELPAEHLDVLVVAV